MAGRILCIQIITAAVLLIVLSTSGGVATAKSTYVDGFCDILFGKVWKSGEYCQDERTDSQKLEDDIAVEKFYNGSVLAHILEEQTNDASSFAEDLNRLVYYGIRARIYSSLTCAINSWGYAEKGTYERSQGPSIDEAKCLIAIDTLYKSHKFMKALRVKNDSTILTGQLVSQELLLNEWIQINAFGRDPSGLLHNRHYLWPGDFDLCTKLDNQRYCYGALRMKNWPANDDPHLMSIRIGLCLPSSCNSNLVDSKETIQKLNEIIVSNLPESQTYELVDIHCLPMNDSPERQLFRDHMSKIVGLIGLGWLALLFYANILANIKYMPVNLKTKMATMCDIFNIKSNWNKLQHISNEQSQLVGLNAVKVILMNYLVCTHTLIMVNSYLFNVQDMRDTFSHSALGASLIQGQHIPPAFFLISGLIFGYKWFSKGQRPSVITKAGVIKIIRNRYLRLAPMYFVIYAFIKQFGHLIGEGPLWDYGVSSQSDMRQCRLESWFVPVLMLANFIPPFSHCVLTGWHLANDFYIYFAIPALWIAYRHSKIAGRLLAVAAFLMSHLYHVWLVHISTNFDYNRLAMEIFMLGPRYLMDRLSYDYVNPFGRIGTYFLGVFLADMIFSKPTSDAGGEKKITQEKESTSQRRLFSLGFSTNRLLSSLSLIICPALIVIPMAGPAILPVSARFMFGKYSHTLTYPLARMTVELGWSMMIYLILKHGHPSQKVSRKTEKGVISKFLLENDGKPQSLNVDGGQKNEKITFSMITGSDVGFLAWPIWDRLVKLNYCLMLMHYMVARLLIQTQRQLIVFSWLNLMQLTSGVIFLNYMICGLVHLAIEMPLTSLVKRWLIQ